MLKPPVTASPLLSLSHWTVIYLAFPDEHRSSLSTLTSLMATTEVDRRRRRERKVKERDAMSQTEGEKNKEESNSGRSNEINGKSVKKHGTQTAKEQKCFSMMT